MEKQKQGIVTLATAEAEYVALESATQEALLVRQFLAEIKSESLEEPIVIFSCYGEISSFMDEPSTCQLNITIIEMR